MRLSKQEVSSIKEAILHYDKNASIYLFGSRVDDTKRGGDIDLLILSDIIDRHLMRKIRVSLYQRLGEQKIDITVDKSLAHPFGKIATQSGLKL